MTTKNKLHFLKGLFVGMLVIGVPFLIMILNALMA